MVSTRSSASGCLAASSSTSPQRDPSRPRPTSTSCGSSKFPYSLPYASLDLRTHPHLYRTGVGEQGVLMVEPYKSELLPHWRFKDPPTATASSNKLCEIFLAYVSQDDFVGADMARKFVQMGFTRARRYANHKGGKKYIYQDDRDRAHTQRSKQHSTGRAAKGKRTEIERLAVQNQEPNKVEAARIFKQILDEKIWKNAEYAKMRENHIAWAKTRPLLTERSQEVQSAILKDPSSQRLVKKW